MGKKLCNNKAAKKHAQIFLKKSYRLIIVKITVQCKEYVQQKMD